MLRLKDYERDHSLAGSLLLASPEMDDPRFKRTVIYLAERNEEGLLGFVINQPLDDYSAEDLAEELAIEWPRNLAGKRLFFGGPVEQQRGFILHRLGHRLDDSVELGSGLYLSASVAGLEDLSQQQFGHGARLFVGCCHWENGQLEQELLEDVWLLSKFDSSRLFVPGASYDWAIMMQELFSPPGHIMTSLSSAPN